MTFLGAIILIAGIVLLIKAIKDKKKMWASLVITVAGLFIVGVGINNANVKAEQHEQHVAKVKKATNKRASEKYKELTSDNTYPLAIKQKINYDSDGTATSAQIWCDESLSNADQATLRHYFALEAQVVSYATNKDDGSFPIVQVYSNGHMIARSSSSNHNETVDLR